MEATDRLERLLALILINQMQKMSQQEKALQLNIAGFSNTEIADLLDTTAGVVAQVLYTARRGSTRRSKKKRK